MFQISLKFCMNHYSHIRKILENLSISIPVDQLKTIWFGYNKHFPWTPAPVYSRLVFNGLKRNNKTHWIVRKLTLVHIGVCPQLKSMEALPLVTFLGPPPQLPPAGAIGATLMPRTIFILHLRIIRSYIKLYCSTLTGLEKNLKLCKVLALGALPLGPHGGHLTIWTPLNPHEDDPANTIHAFKQ